MTQFVHTLLRVLSGVRVCSLSAFHLVLVPLLALHGLLVQPVLGVRYKDSVTTTTTKEGLGDLRGGG